VRGLLLLAVVLGPGVASSKALEWRPAGSSAAASRTASRPARHRDALDAAAAAKPHRSPHAGAAALAARGEGSGEPVRLAGYDEAADFAPRGVRPAQAFAPIADAGTRVAVEFDPFEAVDADASADALAASPTDPSPALPAAEASAGIGPETSPDRAADATSASAVPPAATDDRWQAADPAGAQLQHSVVARNVAAELSLAPQASRPDPGFAEETAGAEGLVAETISPETMPSPADRLLEQARRGVEEESLQGEAEDGLSAELRPTNPFRRDDVDDEEASSGETPEEFADEPSDQLPDAPDYLLEQAPTKPRPLTPEQLRRRSAQIEKERVENDKGCRELIDAVRADRIENIDLSIRVKGNPGEDYPFECGLGDDYFSGRSWGQITYLWKASGLCHKPLYFEQARLERYGHSWGPVLQPIMSGAHFFATVPLLPYKMGLQTPQECVYTLGYYRTGSCAPYMLDPLPFTMRAALFQGAAATAIPFIVP